MYRSYHPDHPGMHNTIYSDSYQYTRLDSKQQQLRKIKCNVVKSLFGFALLVASLLLLIWNEEQAVEISINVNEGLQSIRELSFIGISQEENNNKLVHLTGKLFTDNVLADKDFKVPVHAVHLKRKVEMYQWVQSEIHTINREVPEGDESRIEISYAYDKEWKDKVIGTEKFIVKIGHRNPPEFPFGGKHFTAPVCRVGQFLLSSGLVKKLSKYERLTDLPSPPIGVTLHDGMYYNLQENNIEKPEIGDVRIIYFFAGKTGGNAETVSIIAKQHNLQLLPYTTNEGKIIELLHYGQASPKDMLTYEENHDQFTIICTRIVSWVLSFFGFTFLSSLLNVICRKISVLRTISSSGSYSLRIVLSTTLTFLVASGFWFSHEPSTSMVLIFISSLPYILATIKLRLKYRSSHRNV